MSQAAISLWCHGHAAIPRKRVPKLVGLLRTITDVTRRVIAEASPRAKNAAELEAIIKYGSRLATAGRILAEPEISGDGE